MAPALRQTRMRGKQLRLDPRIKHDGNTIKQNYLVTIPHIRATIRRRLRGKAPAEDDGDGDSECGDDDGRWRRRRGQ